MSAPAKLPNVAIAANKYLRGASTIGDRCEPMTLMPLRAAMQERFTTDAHMVAYTVLENGVESQCFPRLNKAVIDDIEREGGLVYTTMLVLDYDNNQNVDAATLAAAGGGKVAWTTDIVADFRSKLDAAVKAGLPPPNVYFTTAHGARFIYVLPEPILVREVEDVHRGLVHLFGTKGLVADPACSDFTRLFRLPRVMREGRPTWESPYFELVEEYVQLLDVSTLPKVQSARPSIQHAAIKRLTVPRPTHQEARAMLEVLMPGKGRSRQTEAYKEARRLLRGRECFPCLFENAPIAKKGKRNTTLLSYVGEAVSRLLVVPAMSPEFVYALFLPAVEQLEQDADTPDWLDQLWKMVDYAWSHEESKAKPVETSSGGQCDDMRTREVVQQCGEPINNDAYNARLLAHSHGTTMRFITDRGVWAVFETAVGRWITGRPAEALARSNTSILEEVWSALADAAERRGSQLANSGSPTDLVREARRRARELRDAAKRAGDMWPRKSALEAFAADPRYQTVSIEFDRDPDILNCRNCTLNLKTGESHAHRPEDRCTKQTNVDYVQGAEAPTWRRFLEEVLPDPSVRRYLMTAVGAALLGRRAVQKLFVLFGSGANGKSVFLDSILHMLGDYGVRTPSGLLMRQRNGANPHEPMCLMGARFATAAETSEGASFDEEQVKRLTGDETLTARHLYEGFVTFQLIADIFIATNHKPIIKDSGEGMWRRVRLIPFTTFVPEDRRDPDLLEKIRAEGPGVLNWALEGLAIYLKEGLRDPQGVRSATDEYRDDSDIFGRFLEESVLVSADAESDSADIYRCYSSWCHNEGQRPCSRTSFGRKLGERGFRRRKSNGKYLYAGLKLRGGGPPPGAFLRLLPPAAEGGHP